MTLQQKVTGDTIQKSCDVLRKHALISSGANRGFAENLVVDQYGLTETFPQAALWTFDIHGPKEGRNISDKVTTIGKFQNMNHIYDKSFAS